MKLEQQISPNDSLRNFESTNPPDKIMLIKFSYRDDNTVFERVLVLTREDILLLKFPSDEKEVLKAYREIKENVV